MAVHHCAWFCNNKYLVHDRAIRRIAKYLAIMSIYTNLLDGIIWLSTQDIVYMLHLIKHKILRGCRLCLWYFPRRFP